MSDIREHVKAGTVFLPCWIKQPDGTETLDEAALAENMKRFPKAFMALAGDAARGCEILPQEGLKR